jgi:hypothetical protein
MSAPARKATTAYTPNVSDEAAFRRRRNHAQIEAMTGLILQAVSYPTRRHRDFICALQSVNSGNDARVPYTPFRRAHLTLADLMVLDGTPETRRKAVYREISTLRRFQRRTGIVLFHVTPGSEDESTEYTDYLTPAADAAVQRMLSSPLWQTDKAEAKREAVSWAIEQLPRTDPEPEDETESEPPPLDEYQAQVERRVRDTIERAALEIEQRGGDAEAWARSLMRGLQKDLESRKKTAPARLDYSSLRGLGDVDEAVTTEGEDTPEASGNTTGDRSVPPGGDNSVLPPSENPRKTAVLGFGEPTLFSAEAGDVGGEAEAEEPTPLEAALQYARLGWPVFPLHHPDPTRGCSCGEAEECHSPGKHPRTRKGLKDATTDERQIRLWWRHYPLANVGLATGRKSGLVALDVDPRSGGDASLCELVEQYGELPNTLEAVTGGGGTHLLFSHPGVSFRNSSSLVGEGLDVKTDGGYVVAAPSLHASGKRYRWRSRRSPAALPSWLLRLLTAEKTPVRPAATSPKRLRPQSASGALITSGSRNDRLFRIACALRGNGAGYSEIEAAVFEAYELRCAKETEPMSEAELRKIAKSAARYPAGR